MFRFIIEWPRFVVMLGLTSIVLASLSIPLLTKNMHADAFLSPDNPALLYKKKVKEHFGLSDPLVIAVYDDSESGIYQPDVLYLIRWLSDELMGFPNINEDRVVSLATENHISASDEGLMVTPFFEDVPETQKGAESVKKSLEGNPLYLGSLVSSSSKVSLVLAEMMDEELAESSYERVSELLDKAPEVKGVTLYLAGEGAVNGYLSRYVDTDAKRLIPLTALIITLVIILAYRGIRLAIFCQIIVVASITVSLGMMAFLGVEFFVITNALPVILIGISVADSIHVFSHYFDLQEKNPQGSQRDILLETFNTMWRPITLTTLTTMAGFLGLFFAAYMPPFQYFGLFAAVGVSIAWAFSLLVLPALMTLWPPKKEQNLSKGTEKPRTLTKLLSALGEITIHNPKRVVVVYLVLSGLGAYCALNLMVDEAPIDLFHPTEPIAQADRIINRYMNGSNTLDVVVETQVAEGLFNPKTLESVADLQSYALSLPHIQGVSSIVDYLKQINSSMHGDDPDYYRLPSDQNLIAQYFLIYSVSADPSDFEHLVDYDYQAANLRFSLNSGSYQAIKPVVESLQDYIDQQFESSPIDVTITGRVAIQYNWIKDLASSHFSGVVLSLMLVFLVSSLLFKSLSLGVLSLIPVVGAVLIVYASMVLLNMKLGMGTSMFAAVAIGLGVDFSIHTLDRLKTLMVKESLSINAAFRRFYKTTGMALMLNFLAITCGFGVLMLSNISSLNSFGGIVVLAVTTSFIASMTLIPALIKWWPALINPSGRGDSVSVVSMLLLIGVMTFPNESWAQLSADTVVERVNTVDDGRFVTRKLTMKLIDKRGKERLREAIIYRKDYTEETRTALFYLSPANIKNTGFLVWDYDDAKRNNDQWLYLPALRKVRRISSADRGDYFLGTDFTYDDIQLDGKLEVRDYDFSMQGETTLQGKPVYHLSAIPKSDEISKQLGYSRSEIWVDKKNWMVLQSEYWNLKGKPLKRLIASDIRVIDNILTRYRLQIVNHKTGHQTYFIFSDVNYITPVKDAWFSKRALSRGL